jgi:hypothetical protein
MTTKFDSKQHDNTILSMVENMVKDRDLCYHIYYNPKDDKLILYNCENKNYNINYDYTEAYVYVEVCNMRLCDSNYDKASKLDIAFEIKQKVTEYFEKEYKDALNKDYYDLIIRNETSNVAAINEDKKKAMEHFDAKIKEHTDKIDWAKYTLGQLVDENPKKRKRRND